MGRKCMKIIEKLLLGSRFFALFTVLVAITGALTIMLATLPVLFEILRDIAFAETFKLKELKFNAVQILSIIDLLLIVAGMQMIAVGIYSLFINPDFHPPKVMKISGFDDLKGHIIKLTGIVLIISFLEQAISNGPSEYLLEYGVAIALVILSGSVAIYLNSKSNHGESSKVSNSETSAENHAKQE